MTSLLYQLDIFLDNINMISALGGRIIALDIGKKYIGIAISDERMRVAVPSLVLQRKKFNQDMLFFDDYIVKNDVIAMVVGDPLNQHHQPDRWTQSVRSYAVNLQQSCDDEMPIYMADERFSSQAVIDDSIVKKHDNQRIDAHAAAFILQSVLDKMHQ